MTFIQEHWSGILVLVLIILSLIVLGINFLKLSPKQQKERIRMVLLAIVTEMEKQYGPKTGSIKRSQAYIQLIKLFPVLTVFLSQKTFDKLLDEALIIFRNSLEPDENVATYVGEEQNKVEQ